MSETIPRVEALARVRNTLRRGQEAFQRETASVVSELEGSNFVEALMELQARAGLEGTFFNPSFPLDSDLRGVIGVLDDELLTVDEVGTVIDTLLSDRAQRLKTVTEGSLAPETVNGFQNKLSVMLKAALVD